MMELCFQFTREEYEKTVEALLRQRRNSPLNLAVLLMMTLGQFAFVLSCILRYQMPSGQTALLLLLSLAICAVQLFYRHSLPLRAKTQTERAIQKGQINEDFWKKQDLLLHDDLLKLSCGKTKLSYDCAYYSGSFEAAGTLLLLFSKGRSMHQMMISGSAFSSDGHKQAFLDALQEGKIRSINAGFAANRSPRPENAELSLEYRYSRQAFLKDQLRAVRSAYTSRMGWTFSQIARYAAAVFLLYHLFAGSFQSAGMTAFVLFVQLLLLYPLLISFTPLCNLIVRRSTDTLFAGLEEMAFSLDLSEQKLFFSGASFENTLDLRKLYDVLDQKGCTILYWKDNSAITIPAEAATTAAGRALLAALRPVADRNWQSRKGMDLLR